MLGRVILSCDRLYRTHIRSTQTHHSGQDACGLHSTPSDHSPWWCDLVAVTDPAHVPQTVAAALGLSEPADRSVLDAIAGVLQARQTLIINNCEKV